jgi:hypothetical protein
VNHFHMLRQLADGNGFWGGLVVGVLVSALVGLGFWLERDLAGQTAVPETAGEEDVNDTPPPERGVVAKIIDGITLKLESGHVVRYLGVRVPGVGQPVECFGREVLAAQEAIIGQEVRMAVDPVLERAKDGAWVRYVYMKDDKEEETAEATATASPTPGEVDDDETTTTTRDEETAVSTSRVLDEGEDEILINERILEGGFGFPLVSEEVILSERMLAAAKYASATGKGLWKQCEVTEDEELGWLKTNATDECVIKGSTGVTGKKLYRTDECGLYGQTIVLPSQGGQWFCSEDEAKEAGFELAGDC